MSIDLNNAGTYLENFTPQGVYLLKNTLINIIVYANEVIEVINDIAPVNYSKEDFENTT